MSGDLTRTSISAVVVAVLYIAQADAHGMMLEPPSRSSMWRYGFDTPVNYNDNRLYCGGFRVQWNVNGGLCGVCGDAYNGPRENEAGGKYATGKIARTYREGGTMRVTLDITMNHGGYFEFRICPNNDPSRPVKESCLNKHLLALPNGKTRWELPMGHPGNFSLNIALPRGLTCSQCVLQWKYNSASNWGCDADGCGRGHGAQEQFYNCADVAITSSSPHGVIGSINGPAPAVTSRPSTRQPAYTSRLSTPEMITGFLPIGLTSARCAATVGFKLRYQWADQWCESQCARGNCPEQYCQDECRGSSANSFQTLFG